MKANIKRAFLLIPLLIVALATGVRAVAPDPARAAIDYRVLVQQFVDAHNRADVQAVMATFSDDAVLLGGVFCQAPCVGKAPIQREIERRVSVHVQIKITSLQESNGSGVGRLEITDDSTRACGVQRVVAISNIDVRNDKITSVRAPLDPSDAQNLAYLACISAPPAPAVSPPRTGDGGLLSSRS